MSRSPAPRPFVVVLVACSTAVVSLAACGGSSKASTTAASTQGGGSTSSSTTKSGSGGSGGGLKGAVNICSLMPASRVSQITGKTFTMTKEDDTPSYKLYSCDYSTDPTVAGGATPEQMDLDIVGMGGAVGLSADVDAAKQVNNKLTNLTPVSGIGDKAYGGGLEARLEVLYGDVLIKISGLTEVTTDQGKQIISELHSKL